MSQFPLRHNTGPDLATSGWLHHSYPCYFKVRGDLGEEEVTQLQERKVRVLFHQATKGSSNQLGGWVGTGAKSPAQGIGHLLLGPVILG